LDADGYALYHELTFFFHSAGRQLSAQLLKISSDRVLENSLLSCFLLSTMIQFCARCAGRIQLESDLSTEHPPVPIRIQRALEVAEMWCREVGKVSTAWMEQPELSSYFQMAANLFSASEKTSWNRQIDWLRPRKAKNTGISSELLLNGFERDAHEEGSAVAGSQEGFDTLPSAGQGFGTVLTHFRTKQSCDVAMRSFKFLE